MMQNMTRKLVLATTVGLFAAAISGAMWSGGSAQAQDKKPVIRYIYKSQAHWWPPEIDKKIDPNAMRSASFDARCPWDESNYAQLWVNWHYAKMLLEKKQYGEARSMLTNGSTV